MSMFVNTNVSSLNARRSLSNTNVELDRSFQRLSSGFRINSASDDAAGLQISNRLTSQINGLNQATKNANDGISLAQVAEGAMDEITNSLQRIRVLTVQSQNGVHSVYDRDALQKEIDQLSSEIERIADTTQFGGQDLLTGGLNLDFLVGANAGEKIQVELNHTGGYGSTAMALEDVNVIGVLEQQATGIPRPFPVVTQMPGALLLPAYTLGANDGVIRGLQVNGNTLPDMVFTDDVVRNSQLLADEINELFPSTVYVDNGSIMYTGSIATYLPLEFSISDEALTLDDANKHRTQLTSLTGLSATDLGQQAYYTLPPTEEMMRTNFARIDDAISMIDSTRAGLGALQNRFQSTIRNLTNIDENLSAARSRIRDTDYAKETAELTRRQILQQAGTTLLSQANQRPQAALSLLNG